MATYYYNSQIRTYISQFLRIFGGLQVQIGVNRDTTAGNDFLSVPVVYGSQDRVVANILGKTHNTFSQPKLPIISGYLTSIDLDPEKRQSKFHTEPMKVRESGETQFKNAVRRMGNPIKLNLDVSIMASNTDQMFQILEQLLLMFSPTLSFQKSDGVLDWSYITRAELVAISNEENVPTSVDERIIVYTLSFLVDAMLNYPAIINDSIITEIQAKIYDDSFDPIVLEEIIIVPTPNMGTIQGNGITTTIDADLTV